MVVVVVDDSSLQADSQPKSGARVGGRLAGTVKCQMNRVNSRNDLAVMMDDSTV